MLFLSTKVQDIVLISPEIIKAIDTGKDLGRFTCRQVSQVQIWWKCDLPSIVEPGTIIPSDVLQMERSLWYPENPANSTLESVWAADCPMNLEDKLAIICPRKRTLQGDVVLDMIRAPNLKEVLLQVIQNVRSIDDLVSQVISKAQAKCKTELDTMQNGYYAK